MFFPRYNPVEVRPRHEVLFWCVAVLMLLIFLGRNALWGLEGRSAEIIREMLISGKYLTPQINGVFQGTHMPLWYWISLPLTKFIGINEFFLRFPAVISAFVLLWATGKITLKLFDSQTSLIARWVLLGTYGFVFWARTSAPDMANAAAIVCAVCCFLYWKDEPVFWDYFSFYLLLAVGVLFKGAAMAVVTVILLLPMIFVKRKIRQYCSWSNFFALGIILIIGAVLLWIYCRYSGNTAAMLLDNQVLRLLNSRNSNEPCYCYIYHLPRILVPWSVIFFAGFVSFVWKRKELNPDFSTLLIGMVLVFLLFSAFGSRSWYYLLPLVPFCCIVTAAVLSGYAAETKVMDYLLEITYFILLAFVSLAMALPIALPLQGIIFHYNISPIVIVSSFVAGFLVVFLIIFDREEGNFVSEIFGMPPRIASLAAGTAIAVTTLFCAVIPVFTEFRTEKPFALELKKTFEENRITPEQIFFFSESRHQRVLFYLAPEREITFGKDVTDFILKNSGKTVAIIAEDLNEDKVLLKKQLENLGVNSFKADKIAVREKHQNHESASKKKSCAWIFDVKAAPKQKK